MESAIDWHQAKALLEWYVELGVSDAIADAPINRYEIVEAPKPTPKPAQSAKAAPPPPPPEPIRIDWVAEAKAQAARANDLDALAETMRSFEGSPLRKGARNFVFADGQPGARVMIIGDGPSIDEDREGRPFVGGPGTMLGQMFAAIGMSRDAPDTQKALYVTNALPWCAPGRRDPSAEEIAMFRPFLERHITLADPDIVVPMGNVALFALLGKSGIRRARGHWAKVMGKPALPMFHPSALLQTPTTKREAWADLLELQAKLRELT